MYCWLCPNGACSCTDGINVNLFRCHGILKGIISVLQPIELSWFKSLHFARFWLCLIDKSCFWSNLCKYWDSGIVCYFYLFIIVCLKLSQELKERIERLKEKSNNGRAFTSESEFSEEMMDIRKDFVTIHGEMVLLKNYSSLNFAGTQEISILLFSTSNLFWKEL